MEISVARTLDEFAAAEQCSRDEPARQLELKEDHVNIVFVGQVMRAKGLDELIEAMALGEPVLTTTVVVTGEMAWAYDRASNILPTRSRPLAVV